MCESAQLSVTGSPSPLSRARRWLVDTLTAAYAEGEWLEDTVLVASELLTNSLQAGAHEVSVELEMHRASVRIGVTDDARGRPVPRTVDADATSGRGLALVVALGLEWGTEIRSEVPRRKTVWAVVPAAAAREELRCAHAA